MYIKIFKPLLRDIIYKLCFADHIYIFKCHGVLQSLDKKHVLENLKSL